MIDPTDAHRRGVRRAITLAGMPPAADPAARSRRAELIDAMAQLVADAEARGPAAATGPAGHCTAAGCGGRLVLADDGRWHHTGPHGAGLHRPIPAAPLPLEVDAYRHGLGQAFAESLAALTAPSPEATIRAIADHYGVTRNLDGPPGETAGDLLRFAREETHRD